MSTHLLMFLMFLTAFFGAIIDFLIGFALVRLALWLLGIDFYGRDI